MSVAEVSIDNEAVQAVLSASETHFVDLKSRDIKPAKLTRTIAAFANADGGELYIGIEEIDRAMGVREWRGFDRIEEANGHLQAFEGLFPLGQNFDYTFLRQENGIGGFVLQVVVRKTRDIKMGSDGVVYVRRGAQNLPVQPGSALKQLEYAKGITSFETETVAVPKEYVTNSEPVIEFMLHVVPTAEPEAWLKKQQLIAEGKPTVAGVVLFAEEPQALLPKRCGIKVYRYRTSDAEGSRDTLATDPVTVEGHLYAQIHEAVRVTIKLIQLERRLGDATLEEFLYPHETLHEIITNAVLHRDYSVADDVHIRVFDNRVEVQSPGRLPAHITVENILDERCARNGTIVRLINKFPNPPNKDVGEGLNTAFAAMTKLGLKVPTIIDRETGVLVVIKHERLASPETLILEHVEAHGRIRNKEARQICHIGADYVVKGIFGRLTDRGLLQRVAGTDRATTAYEKGPNFMAWRAALQPAPAQAPVPESTGDTDVDVPAR